MAASWSRPRSRQGSQREQRCEHASAEQSRERKHRLPQLGVYEPIWKYDLEPLEKDLSAHLVFGTATAAAYSLLAHVELEK